MRFEKIFPNVTMDYFGYVSPANTMREVCECISRDTDHDGVGFLRMITELGATWMMGQFVLESFQPIPANLEVEIVTLPYEKIGVSVMRRVEIRHQGQVLARQTNKTLPVYYQQRKVVPPEAYAYMWETPAGEPGEDLKWVDLPEDMELVERYPVKYCDCDTNGHLTAFRYVELICELSGYWGPELHLIRRLQVDFRKECLPGETISLYHGMRDGVHYVAGLHENGRPAFHASLELAEETCPRVADELNFDPPTLSDKR